MTQDTLFKKIQKITNANPSPIIVLGSGASIPYGIASMGILAQKLLDYFEKKNYTNTESTECIKSFSTFLKENYGLEEALLKAKVTDEVENDIVCEVWKTIEENDNKVFMDLVNGKKLDLAALFDYLIYNRKDCVINVVSTNYDRLAEYAVAMTGAYLNTGYTPVSMGKLRTNLDSYPVKTKEHYIGKVNIWKVHGSLDWFRNDVETLNRPNIREIPSKMIPCIITPGINKYEKTQQSPHRELLSKIDECFNNASGFICIGYGFNDNHVHPKLLEKSMQKHIPILIITKEITSPIKEKVMDGKHEYIIICEGPSGGTDIKTSDGEELHFEKNYWQLRNFLEIIK